MSRGAGRRPRLLRPLCLLLCLLLLLGAAGCSDRRETADESDGARYTERLSVGFDQDFPPFSYVSGSGEYSGFDVELAREVCQRNNWDFIPVSLKWDTKDQLLEDGTIDCIWSCFSMTTREQQYAWSIPYLNNRIVLLTSAGSGLDRLTDLAGKVVCVESSTSQASQITHEFLALEQSFRALYMVDDYSVALLYLRSGKADALLADRGVAEYYLEQYPDELRLMQEALSDDQCGVAFRQGDTGRAEEISRTLRELAADGTLQALAERWGLADMLCVSGQP